MKRRDLDKLGLEPDPLDGRHPFSETELARFEKKFKHKLPPDYVEFLRHHNGDWPSNAPTFGDAEVEVQSFFYLRPEGEVEIDDPKVGEFCNLWVQHRQYGKTLGDGVLPIADTSSGSPVLVVCEKDKSWIGFINLEEAPPKRKSIEHLADSFTEFVKLLQVK